MKVKTAILGSGNIGTDLLLKALRSSVIRPVWLVGIDPDSEGLARAKGLGVKTTHDGVDGFLAAARDDDVKLVFDATSAHVHPENDRKLRARGMHVIDLTPAAIGPYCVPPVNLADHLANARRNVNMVTCGGQATIPIIACVSKAQAVDYGEIIATLSSSSAGPGTRRNIDEFTRTTAKAIETLGGAAEGKAIIIINPADPPIMMRNTVHCITRENPDQAAITAAVHSMVRRVRDYVPGYQLTNGPVFDGHRVSIYLKVEGLGDYLPAYAGNLDIMTAAALRTAELIAKQLADNSDTSVSGTVSV